MFTYRLLGKTMNETMFNTATKMNNDNSKNDYGIRSIELDKRFLPWSSLEENKYLIKHRYISCSKSVPHRSKHFMKYKLSRSLNFDGNICSSGSENSSLEEDKCLSRSAKIMRALNFNNSPTYYGKTKTKRSLNFNSTPSPKRFVPGKKSIRKTLSLSFTSPLPVTNKILDFENSPNDSASSSLMCTSSESIDENQNETPSRQSAKEHKILHYSTPNIKLSKKSLLQTADCTPVLRSRLKKTVDSIACVAATPNSKSIKCIANKSKRIGNTAMSTSRSLLPEFEEKDDSRPCTPENVIHIVPESMSAIKRSHKKERLSKRNERCATESANDSNRIVTNSIITERRRSKRADPFQDLNFIAQYSRKNSEAKQLPLCNSEDDISDTGSLFDYSEEQENILQKSEKAFVCMSNYDDNVLSSVDECNVKIKPEENISDIEVLNQSRVSIDCENVDADDILMENIDDKMVDVRSVTPEQTEETKADSEKVVTPENRINFLEAIARESIKKSHKKKKDDKKGKLFNSKVLQCKHEITEREGAKCWQTLQQAENLKGYKLAADQNHPYDALSEEERAYTPEKVNSSRLLLLQYSSVKKSHKKDKHNKILSGFLKRQEYFNREYNVDDTIEYRKSMETLSSDFDSNTSASPPVAGMNDNTSIDKFSPSKRKKLLNTSMDHDTSASCDSELQECDSSTEDFKIFTPLKRKKSLINASNVKECLHFYTLPSGKDEILEEGVIDMNYSRCLTPVSNFNDIRMKSEESDDFTTDNSVTRHLEIDVETAEAHDCGSNETNGRSTPRNMPTTELYLNLDSIKKSHKKNKRGNSSRVGLIRNNVCLDGENSDNDWSADEKVALDKTASSNDSIEYDDNVGVPINRLSNETLDAQKDTDNVSTNVTPPNCLTVKNYMRLLQGTSIKRSHKKVRNQRKREFTVEANQLSDDGSVFDDEEELASAEANSSIQE